MKKHFLFFLFFLVFTFNIFAQTYSGNTVICDGDSDFVFLSGNPVNDLNEGTIETWIYLNAIDEEPIFAKQNDGFLSSAIFSVGFTSTPNGHPVIGDSGRIYFHGQNLVTSASSKKILEKEHWYHIAIAFTQQYVNFYINGLLDTSVTGNYSILNDPNPNYSCIGSWYTTSFWSTFLNGKIDEIRIWNIERTQNQILTTMNDTLGISYYSNLDSGLIAYWRFDNTENLGINSDGSDDIRDFSVYGNHGDLEGDAFLATSGAFVGITNNISMYPFKFKLMQNYPNPFNPATTIQFELPNTAEVEVSIYNIAGQKIMNLFSGIKSAGLHSVNWDASGFASGVYYAVLKTNTNIMLSNKLILMK